MLHTDLVIFINPPSAVGRKLIRNFDCATESKGNYLYQPYDKLLLSSHYEANQFVLFDAIADKMSQVELFECLKEHKIKYFIVSVADTNWIEDKEFLQKLHSIYPDRPIYAFGDSLIEATSREELHGIISGVLSNPLELNVEELENHIKEKGNQWFQGSGFVKEDTYSRVDLKKPIEININIPNHQKFLHENYRWPFSRYFKYTTVFTSWGCPYSCSYCIVAKFPNTYRNYRNVLEELRHIKTLGLNEIYIGDRSFGLPRSNVIQLLKAMIEEDFNFSWSTYFHPNQYDPELLELMKRSGCHTLIIGIESHNFKSLKKYGRHMKEDRFYGLLKHAKKIGIEICGDFIIGLPNETKEDIHKTIKLSKELDIDYASFNIAAPLAGSSLREDAKKDGRISPGEENHFDSFGYHKVLSNGVLSGEEILKLRNQAVKDFYFNPRYLFKSLFRIHSFEHLIIQVQEMLQILFKTK